MMDFGTMQDMLWSTFAKQTDDWKPEYKQILQNTVVDVIKEKTQIRIVVRSTDASPQAAEVREYLLKVLFDPAARIMGGFKCQVRKFEEA
jgi:agmatine/peptidylarginine deiminase